MALPATTVLEVQPGGNDANGGGFNSAAAGTDRSLSTSPFVTIDGATITATVHTATTQLNLTGYTVTSADVGNLLKVAGGTATAGTYCINSVDVPNNRWTLDRAVGTAAQTATGRMGGCKATPGEAATIVTMGTNDVPIWVKGGTTYTMTTSTPGAAGPIVLPNGFRAKIEAYTTTRGDKGIATISAGSVTGITMLSGGTSTVLHVEGLIVDGNSGASNIGINTGARWLVHNCEAKNCVTGVIGTTGIGTTSKCKATTCTTGFNNILCIDCVATGGTTGFSLTTANASDCIAYANSGDGFILSGAGTAAGCTSYGNGGDGFDLTSTTGTAVIDCIATGNTGYQFNTSASASHSPRLVNCAGKNDGTGIFQSTPPINVGFVTLTSDPFANAAGADFKLNNTAGGGAAARALAISPYGQTSYRDIGATQHQDSGGGGGVTKLAGCGGGLVA